MILNVPRFQLALNSDDPDIVKLGLRQFFQQILSENGAVDSFGKDGTSSVIDINFEFVLNNPFPATVSGLLRDYLDASPQIEEFFILWNLPNRSADAELCALHMQTLSAIIFCCGLMPSFARYCSNRIMSQFESAIVQQLQQKDVFLTQMTLALVNQCYRQTKSLPDELFGYVLRTGLGEKTCILDGTQCVADGDSRGIVTVVILSILNNQADPTSGIKIFTDDLAFKNLFRDLHVASDRAVRLLLRGLLHLVSSVGLIREFVGKVVSRLALSKISELSLNDESVQKMNDAEDFLAQFMTILMSISTECTSLGKSGSRSIQGCINDLLDSLKPIRSVAHKKIQMQILNTHSIYLKKCIHGLKRSSWEPNADDEYLDMLGHLVFLIQQAPIDQLLLTRTKNMVLDSSSGGIHSFRALITQYVASLFPVNFDKKDLVRLYSNPSNVSVRLLGVDLLKAILIRLEQQFKDALYLTTDRTLIESIMAESVADYIPDIASVYQIHALLFSALNSLNESSKHECPQQPSEEMDLEINFGQDLDAETSSADPVVALSTSSASKAELHRASHAAVLCSIKSYLQCLSCYCRLSPVVVAKSRVDFVKFIDDLKETLIDVYAQEDSSFQSLHADVFEALLQLLELASDRGLISWFGSEDDANKLFNALLVNEDWSAAVKKSSLSQLFVTSTYYEEKSEQARSAWQFKAGILQRSGLFGDCSKHNVHPSLSVSVEIVAWLRACQDAKTAALLDVLIRMTYHFSPMIESWYSQQFQTEEASKVLSLPLQFALLLITGNLSPFRDCLPRFIANYITGFALHDLSAVPGKTAEQCAQFFDKFSSGFRFDLEQVLQQVISTKLAMAIDSADNGMWLRLTKSLKPVFTNCTLLLSIEDILARHKFSLFESEQEAVQLKSKRARAMKNKVAVPELDWESISFADACDFVLRHSEQLFAMVSSHKSDEKTSKFVRRHWQLLSVLALRNQNTLSSMALKIFSFVEVEISLSLASHQLQYLGNALYGLRLLVDVSRVLHAQLQQEADIKKPFATSLLLLADSFTQMTLQSVSKLDSELRLELLSCSVLIDNIAVDSSFGMICRRIFCLILLSIPVHLVPSDLLLDISRRMLSCLQLQSVVFVSDGSFAELLSILAKLTSFESEVVVLADLHTQLKSVYLTTRAATSSTFFSDFSCYGANEVSVIAFNDMALEFPKSCPLRDISSLLLTIKKSDATCESSSSSSGMVRRSSAFQFPQFRCQNGSWSFFDLSSLVPAADISVAKTALESVLLDMLGSQWSSKEAVDVPMRISSLPTLADAVCSSVSLEFDDNEAKEVVLAWMGWVQSVAAKTSNESLDLRLSNHLYKFALGVTRNVTAAANFYNAMGELRQSLRSMPDGTDAWKIASSKLVLWSCQRSSNKLDDALLLELAVDCLPIISLLKDQDEVLTNVDKWLKAILWKHIHSARHMKYLRMLMQALFLSEETVWPLTEPLPSKDHSLNPLKMLRLLSSHRDFGSSISECMREEGLNNVESFELLRLVLTLVTILSNSLRTAEFDAESISSTLTKLQKLLLLHFKGQLSESDRTLSRILIVMHSEFGIGQKFSTLRPLSSSNAKSQLSSPAMSLIDMLKPSIVYNTLADFPLWRRSSTQPFLWEKNCDFDCHSADAYVKYAGLLCGNARLAQDAYVENPLLLLDFGDLIYSSSPAGVTVGQTEYTNESVAAVRYDPSFVIPAILGILRNASVPIRLLVNCGGLSLLFATLASHCSILRSYAVAALALVWKAAHEQDAERDPLFRERPQILQLLNFLRNAIDGTTADKSQTVKSNSGPKQRQSIEPAGAAKPSVFKSISQVSFDGTLFQLPSTTALFLAKAALNLMQPKHELFLSTSLYLIGRPFCDVRDLPLFDLLVQNADAETEQSERVSVLRFMRDSLCDPKDHMNLSRKHAYSKLMMLFESMASDVRTGHVIFDIFDAASCQRESARFLLEKCSFASWLQSFFVQSSLDGSVGPFFARALSALHRLLIACYLMLAEFDNDHQRFTEVDSILVEICGQCLQATNSLLTVEKDRGSQRVGIDSWKSFTDLLFLCQDAIAVQKWLSARSLPCYFASDLLASLVVTNLRTGNTNETMSRGLRYSLLMTLSSLSSLTWWQSSCETAVKVIMESAVHVITGSFSKNETFVLVDELHRQATSNLGFAQRIEFLLNNSDQLPATWNRSDRVALAWEVLASSKDMTTDSSAIDEIAMAEQLTSWLATQCSSIGDLQCTSTLVTWTLIVWKLCSKVHSCGNLQSQLIRILNSVVSRHNWPTIINSRNVLQSFFDKFLSNCWVGSNRNKVFFIFMQIIACGASLDAKFEYSSRQSSWPEIEEARDLFQYKLLALDLLESSLSISSMTNVEICDAEVSAQQILSEASNNIASKSTPSSKKRKSENTAMQVNAKDYVLVKRKRSIWKPHGRKLLV